MGKEHLHKSIIIENVFSSLWIIIIMVVSFSSSLFQNAITNEEETIETLEKVSITPLSVLIFILILIGAILVMSFIFYIKWKHTYIYFNNDLLIIEKGKIVHKKTEIKLKDIAAINMKKNVLEKMIGTCNLKIELNNQSETTSMGKIVFKDDIALKFKNNVLNRMGNKEEETLEEINTIIDFNMNDIIRHYLLGINIPSFIISITVYIGIFAIMLGENGKLSILVLIILTLMFIGPLIWKSIKALLVYQNFKVCREDDIIKLSYGALTTLDYKMPISRINATLIKQTLQARLKNKYVVEVVNAGMGNEQEEKKIITLFNDKKNIDNLMNELIPEYKIKERGNKQSIKTVILYLIYNLYLILIVLGLSYFISIWFLILLIIVLLIVIFSYITKELHCENNKLVITSGIFNKRTAIIKMDKIELLSVKDGPILRLLNLKKLSCNIIGNGNDGFYQTGYYEAKYIDSIVGIYKEVLK